MFCTNYFSNFAFHNNKTTEVIFCEIDFFQKNFFSPTRVACNSSFRSQKYSKFSKIANFFNVSKLFSKDAGKRLSLLHSVKNWEFSCQSDFTWDWLLVKLQYQKRKILAILKAFICMIFWQRVPELQFREPWNDQIGSNLGSNSMF